MHVDSDNIKEVMQALVDSGAVLIRGYRSKAELVAEIQNALDDGNSAIFVPTLRTMRTFFNTHGFIAAMDDISTQLKDFRIVIEPDKYGVQHVMAVSPVGDAESTEQ